MHRMLRRVAMTLAAVMPISFGIWIIAEVAGAKDQLQAGSWSEIGNVGATVLVATLTVWAAYWLWTHQQAVKQGHLRRVAVAMFEEAYRRLLDLEAMTKFESWREYRRDAGSADVLPGPNGWKIHRESVSPVLFAIQSDMEFLIANFSVVRDNLIDFNEEELHAVLRLSYLLGGVPKQIQLMREAWDNGVAGSPAELSPELRSTLTHIIAGAAHFLNLLDSTGNRPRSVNYLRVLAAQSKMRNRGTQSAP